MIKSAQKRFLIVDGHALLHRAWHALPPLTTRSGLVVTGAYGFTMILLKAISELKPDFVAVTFDLKGPTFRHERYEAYKATREKKPEELYAQVPIIERILSAMGIAVFTAKGFEADDVIGTLTEKVKKKKDIETIIVTGDLDTLQLVDERTKVFTLRCGMTDTMTYDEKAVAERFGFGPEFMVDYKALRGDPSDNIPGVKGIGEKTASELILTFGTIERLYASLEKDDDKAKKLKPSVREKLLASKKDALEAKVLCQIRTDVPIKFTLDGCAYSAPERERLAPIFEELQFTRLLSQIPESTAPVAKTLPRHTADVVITRVENRTSAKDAIARLSKADAIAWRTVTADEDPVTPKIIAVGVTDGREAFAFSSDAAPALADIFSRKHKTFVCHDLKRETTAFASLGVAAPEHAFDLMLASYLLYAGERRHTLDAMLAFHRNVAVAEEVEDQFARLAAELLHLLPMAKELGGQLKEHQLDALLSDLETPVAPVLSRMERAGIAVDLSRFTELSIDLGKKLDDLTERIHRLAGGEFNINSPRQLGAILFEKLAISPAGMKKTAKGGAISTAAAELEKLRGSHPIVADILIYREFSKLKSTYVDAIPLLAHPKTGRVHARFNQTVTATGRLSSSDPNLQNIPTPETEYGKKVRNGFVARKGCVLLAADYSQFELRIAAHVAGEKSMIEAFRKGEDIHRRTAAEMFGEDQADAKRRIAKTINFGILYGMGPQRLSESAGISFMEARDYIERYFAIHGKIAEYMEDRRRRVRDEGYVETLFGRKRFFRNFRILGKREQAEAERQAINMPIQGTQADMIKLAMVRIDDLFRKKYDEGDDAGARMLVQVHDELIFEVKKGLLAEVASAVVPIMEKVYKLDVPIVVNASIGDRWGDLKPLK